MSLAEKKIVALLKEEKILFELFEHEPVYSCEQAAKVREVSLSEGIKCLLLKSERRFILAITRGNRRIDLKKLAMLEEVKRLELAKPNEVEKIASCPVGCVHPFCDVPTYVDEAFLNLEFIEFNPGAHNKTVRMKATDLVHLLKNATHVGFTTPQNTAI